MIASSDSVIASEDDDDGCDANVDTETKAKESMKEKETPWIDAWIRWERDSKDVVDGGGDEEEVEADEEEQEMPPPTEMYCFEYSVPPVNNNNRIINIELKGYKSESEQIWNSTGLTLWRSSHYLCEYLIQEQHQQQEAAENNNNKTIIELGSGLGRCGILAHKLGIFQRVYCTDGDTDTLRQLRSNVLHNTTSTTAASTSNNIISCQQLLWGTKTTKEFMNINNLDSNDGVDIMIIGSDLIYVPQVIQPLFETVNTLLKDCRNGVFIMAHCTRRVGNAVNIDMIFDVAKNFHFQHEIVIDKDKEDDISVYKFTKEVM